MNRKYKMLNDLATKPWVVAASGVSALLAFILLKGRYPDSEVAQVVFWLSFLSLVFLYVYSVKVRADNIALRSLSGEFFDINRIYQRTMQQTFLVKSPVTDQELLIKTEKETLEAVCQRICSIFERVVGRKCMVTIKLITYEERENACYAYTYARSIKASARDEAERVRYSVGDGLNTGFEEALKPRPDGSPPHFHSFDLSQESSDYSNQRRDYLRHYRSVLVVPIREPVTQQDCGPDESNVKIDSNLIGFLCVDTLSINRLNNSFHLIMLSALASQMYTFMCFMRGRYMVLVG